MPHLTFFNNWRSGVSYYPCMDVAVRIQAGVQCSCICRRCDRQHAVERTHTFSCNHRKITARDTPPNFNHLLTQQRRAAKQRATLLSLPHASLKLLYRSVGPQKILVNVCSMLPVTEVAAFFLMLHFQVNVRLQILHTLVTLVPSLFSDLATVPKFLMKEHKTSTSVPAAVIFHSDKSSPGDNDTQANSSSHKSWTQEHAFSWPSPSFARFLWKDDKAQGTMRQAIIVIDVWVLKNYFWKCHKKIRVPFWQMALEKASFQETFSFFFLRSETPYFDQNCKASFHFLVQCTQNAP